MHRSLVGFGLALSGWCSLALAQTENQTTEYDILGFKTGMTIEETDAKFIELGWIKTDERAFIINGTDIEFISGRTYKNANAEGYQDQIQVEFSKPPADRRIIRLYRDYKPFGPLGGNSNLLPLEQMKASVVKRYGPFHGVKNATRAQVLKWSTDLDPEKCANHSPGEFRINPSSGRSIVPNCHGLHLSVNMQFTPRNIGPVITTVWSELIDVDEWRINDVRFNRYAVELQTEIEEQKAKNAEAPPL